MVPANIILYFGVAIVLFGGALLLFKSAPTAAEGDNKFEALGIRVSSSSPGLLVMGIGVALIVSSQAIKSTPPIPPSPPNDLHGQQAPINPSALLSEFKIAVHVGNAPEAVMRQWRRVAPDRWVESYPQGNSTFFEVTDRTTLDGCAGTVAKNQVMPSHRVFIPDIGCNGMPFYINDDNRGWGIAAQLTDAH